MDSVSHILVGGAIGEATLGRKAGFRAMAWGAAISVLPDIDVAIGQFMSEIDELVFHRGWTHSLIFLVVMTPLIGSLISKFHSNLDIPPWRWILLVGLSLSSHIFLDLCTSYGTQVLLPFNDTAFAWSTIAIIDPVFTLPYLVAIPFIIRYRHNLKNRRLTSLIVLIVSFLYLGLTFINKAHVERQFHSALDQQDVSYDETIVKPILFSNLLWRGIARQDDSYVAGFYALPDERPFNQLYELEGNHHLAEKIEPYETFQQIRWITEGYYSIHAENDSLFLNDLRFGRMGEWEDRSSPYTFSYYLDDYGAPPDSMRIDRVDLEFEGDRDRQLLRSMINRIRNGPVNSAE